MKSTTFHFLKTNPLIKHKWETTKYNQKKRYVTNVRHNAPKSRDVKLERGTIYHLQEADGKRSKREDSLGDIFQVHKPGKDST